jgi:hypothetical protein
MAPPKTWPLSRKWRKALCLFVSARRLALRFTGSPDCTNSTFGLIKALITQNHDLCTTKLHKIWRWHPLIDFLYKIPQFSVYWLNRVHTGPTNDNGWCEQLYEDQAAKLILYGRALGLSHAEAEDVLQETFIALLRRIR